MCPPIRTACHSHLVSFPSNPPVEPYIALQSNVKCRGILLLQTAVASTPCSSRLRSGAYQAFAPNRRANLHPPLEHNENKPYSNDSVRRLGKSSAVKQRRADASIPCSRPTGQCPRTALWLAPQVVPVGEKKPLPVLHRDGQGQGDMMARMLYTGRRGSGGGGWGPHGGFWRCSRRRSHA